jgi:hypothetical protein
LKPTTLAAHAAAQQLEAMDSAIEADRLSGPIHYGVAARDQIADMSGLQFLHM